MSLSALANNNLVGLFAIRYYFDLLIVVFLQTLQILIPNYTRKEMAPTLAVVGNQMKAVPRPVNICKDRRRSSEEVTLGRAEDSSKNSNHGVTIVKMCNRLAIKRDNHSYQDIYEFEGYRGPKSPSIEKQLSTKPPYHVEPKRTPKQSEFTLELQQNASTVETQSMPVASTKESIACMSPPSLAELMERKPDELLLIDCRNFIDYNSNHILGALNISCTNRIMRRRLVDGKVTINDLVSGGDEAKKLYKEKEDGNTTMVLYDENAINVASLSNDHSLKLLANKLHSQGKDVKFLFGTFNFTIFSASNHWKFKFYHNFV